MRAGFNPAPRSSATAGGSLECHMRDMPTGDDRSAGVRAGENLKPFLNQVPIYDHDER